MKGYISKYEKAVSLAESRYGKHMPEWQLKNTIRAFFVAKLLPGAIIRSTLVDGKNLVTVTKANGHSYTYESKF